MASLFIHQVLLLLSTGWSSECLLDWNSFTSLAIPSMLMMCIEWWTYEIGSFLIGQWRGELPGHGQAWPRAAPTASADPSCPAGLLSVVELSVQSIIYEVSVVAFMVRAGLSLQTRAPRGLS